MTPDLVPPTEHVQTSPIRLYDLRAIELATVLSSEFAGAYLVARNLRALGQPKQSRNALLWGFLALVPLTLLIFSIVIPERFEPLLAVLVQGGQAVAVHVFAKRSHGDALAKHASTGGAFYSRWRAAGVALLVIPVPLIVMVLVALAFPRLPALAE